MWAGIPELLLLSIATASAAIAAVFAILCFVTPKGPRQNTICSLGDLSPRPRAGIEKPG